MISEIFSAGLKVLSGQVQSSIVDGASLSCLKSELILNLLALDSSLFQSIDVKDIIYYFKYLSYCHPKEKP